MTRNSLCVCGNAIDRQARPWSAWCSEKCRYRARDAAKYVARTPVICTVTCSKCGRSFTYTRSGAGRVRQRCDLHRGYVPATHPEQPCAWCHLMFVPVKSSQMYCSDTHRYAAKNARRSQLGRGAACA